MRTALAARSGDLHAGAAIVVEAVELAELTGQDGVLLSALGLTGIVHAFLGDERACRRSAERARALSDAGAGRQASITHTCLGHPALARRDLDEAAASSVSPRGRTGRSAFAEPGSQPWVADHS